MVAAEVKASILASGVSDEPKRVIGYAETSE
jgi:hypothetical protein